MNIRSLNINTASIEELAKLPGVGSELAQRIIHAREENGRFCNVSGLISIAGMTQDAQRSLEAYTYAIDVMIAPVPKARPSNRDLLLAKFRALFAEHEGLLQKVREHLEEMLKKMNPGLPRSKTDVADAITVLDADAALALYVDAVLHAMGKLEEKQDIVYFETWEIPADGIREYDLPVLVCRRFAMGAGSKFLLGPSINPTFTIIAEEIEMDPDSTWSWTPRHPILPTPAEPPAAPGRPDFDPWVYESGQPQHTNGLDGGSGSHGREGACPDDLVGHGACEPPTVQIIALRLLALSRFDLRGQDGARGGRGQDGGAGGDGSRGRNGEEGFAPGPLFIPIPYCKQTPGRGGLGGRGGDAGDGGRGGDGGDGGRLHIYTTPESFANLIQDQPGRFLQVQIETGSGGAGGEPGVPGTGGRNGETGALPRACEREYQERVLDDGLPGSAGRHGQAGAEGQPGGISFVPITDLDFALILDLPVLEGLNPAAAPPGATVELIGRNVRQATGVVVSTHPHTLPIMPTAFPLRYRFTVPDVAGGWVEVSLENGGHLAPDWTLGADVLDFMVTPRIDRIDGPAPGVRSVWTDAFTIQGAGFRPDSDRVRIHIAGTFYTGIIDPNHSSQHQLLFRLPQVDTFVDVPQGDWDTVVIGSYGHGSNTVPLELHACRSVPLRPMPLFEDWTTADYPYRPSGFYFQNFAEGVPDWDLFLDTYGKANIGVRVAVDILFNAVVMSSIGTLTPVGGRLGALLTLPGTIGYYYAVWYYFLNGTIGEGMCTGISAQALLDHLVGIDCFGRPWDGLDTTARRLITLGSSRMLSDEVLFGTLYGQCAREAASIPEAYIAIRDRMAAGYTRDQAPILFFLPSGEIADDPVRFVELLRQTHAVVPYLIVEEIPTPVEIAGVSQTRLVDRIYIYDSNRPFAPYDTGVTGLSNEDQNAIRPHPDTWDGLPTCPVATGAPCRQASPSYDPSYVSIWDETGSGDWRFFYHAGMSSEAGFTLGVSPLQPFNGEQYLNLPIDSWFGLLPQVLELLLSPATLQGVYRWDPEAEEGLGEPIPGAKSASATGRLASRSHEIYFTGEQRPTVRVLCGTADGSSYSYRHCDPLLDVGIIDMPTAEGEEDLLYIDPAERLVELRTRRSSGKRVHLLLQRWTGDEADYLSLRNLPLSAAQPLRVSVAADWTGVRVQSRAAGRRVDCHLYRLTPDGAARQHREELLLQRDGAGFTFDSWESVCDEELELGPRRQNWMLRDMIDCSESGSRAAHGYSLRKRPPKVDMDVPAGAVSKVQHAIATAAVVTGPADRERPTLPVDALWVESFRVGSLIPLKPLKLVRRMSNRGSSQRARVLVNGQPVSRSDWLVEAEPWQDASRVTEKLDPKAPFLRRSVATMDAEFVIPSSYVTAPELDIRLDVVESDFAAEPSSYRFLQEPILSVIEVVDAASGLDAKATLDNGLTLPLDKLLDIANHRQVAVQGLKTARRPDGLSIQWEPTAPPGVALRVERVQRDKSGQPKRFFLNDGASYAAEALIAEIEASSLRLTNAYLAGKPNHLRVELVGESTSESFAQSVKMLFAKSSPTKKRG